LIKLLADENIPKKTVDLLKAQGVDVISVQESSSGLSDRDILDLAKAKGRIVVTFDKDFGQIIFKEKYKSQGLILLRFVPESPQQISKRILQLLATKIRIEKNVVVIKEDSVKVTSSR